MADADGKEEGGAPQPMDTDAIPPLDNNGQSMSKASSLILNKLKFNVLYL